MQIDLKSMLRFKRYCIFLSKSIKDSLHAASWWVAGLSCGWLASLAEGLCICYSKYTLLHFSLVSRVCVYIYIYYLVICIRAESKGVDGHCGDVVLGLIEEITLVVG